MKILYKGKIYIVVTNESACYLYKKGVTGKDGRPLSKEFIKKRIPDDARKQFTEKGLVMAFDSDGFIDIPYSEVCDIPDLKEEIFDIIPEEYVIELLSGTQDHMEIRGYTIDEKYGWTSLSSMVPYLIKMRCEHKRLKDFPELTHNQWLGLNGKYNALFNQTRTLAETRKNLETYQSVNAEIKERLERRRLKLSNPEYFEGYGKEAYEFYLQTQHWQDVRNMVLERDEYRCTSCNSNLVLQSHHTSYKNTWIKDREINDCITLCKNCHEKWHLENGMPE